MTVEESSPPTPGLPLGLGTGKVDDREVCIDAVRSALDLGYRHVDTAQGYENEADVGTALERANVAREAVTLATKVLQHNLAHDEVLRTVERSLERLRVDAVDVLYVHWPTHDYDPEATLAALDDLYDRERADRIGVCNFTQDQLVRARDLLDAPLSVYQVEHHPLFRPTDVVEYCHEAGIDVVGYSPLADGRAIEEPVIERVAADRDATPAQVCLAWSLAHGVTPIPKSTGDHLAENLAATQLTLTEAEVAAVDGIGRSERVYDPAWAPWN